MQPSPIQTLAQRLPLTPAFVYDEAALLESLAGLERVRAAGGKVFYSIKAFPFAPALRLMRDRVDGFSASSLFEARLARRCLAGKGLLSLTTPGLRSAEMAELAGLCDFIAFNSEGQYRRLSPLCEGRASLGLRLNPGLSFLEDPRYDPCRPHSKLGLPLTLAQSILAAEPAVEGLHFHTLFSAPSFAPLETTVAHLEQVLGKWLRRIRWLNLGGGYLFRSRSDLDALVRLVARLRQRYGLQVHFEPGKAVIGRAGHLVATVLDLFESGGKTVAILDTGVHHLPEVFEYQIRPPLLQEAPGGAYSALLAGGSCLAGDVFGEYRFEQPLRVGQRLLFPGVGAYTLVKASRFNGINLPAIFALHPDGRLSLRKRYGFDDFECHWQASDPL